MIVLTLPYPLSANRLDLSTPCLDGPGERTRLGYVRLHVAGRKVLAHVHAWETVNGPVPSGLELDHCCRNRWCRNALHLEPVTHRVNSQRAANRKLSNEKAAAIRAAYLPRVVTQVALAAQYGVSRRTIECVLNGKFWP